MNVDLPEPGLPANRYSLVFSKPPLNNLSTLENPVLI